MKGKKLMESNHTFVICAYKESPYLEECIRSLVSQTVKTNIIISTSTPNEYIKGLADKYKLDLYVNEGERGITQDWNFAYSKADTKYITIAHQDDRYSKRYVETLLREMDKSKKPLIFFTDYYEIRNDEIVKSNKILKIKRVMLLPLRLRLFWSSKFVRRRVLSLGCPICCPSVTFARENVPEVIFEHGFRADEDWQAWERLSKLSGQFIYCTGPLTYHRIHEASETTKILGDNARYREDIEMFGKFWPRGFARWIAGLYGTSEKSNNIE